jgi:hypothetical protein
MFSEYILAPHLVKPPIEEFKHLILLPSEVFHEILFALLSDNLDWSMSLLNSTPCSIPGFRHQKCCDCICNTTLICVWFCIVTSVNPHMEIHTNTYNISTFYLRFI